MARNFYKRNFVDAVKIITPNLYLDDDFDVSGSQVKDTDLVINSHILSAKNIQETLKLSSSALTGSNLYSSIDNINGFSQFFVKQNKLTNITPEKFQRKILKPLGQKLSSFQTSSDFGDYVSGTLLPKIYLNNSNIKTDTSSYFGGSQLETTEYIISNLNWLYFLNTSAPAGGSLAPSTLVASSIVNTLWNDKPYKLNDAIKDYQTYLWENFEGSSVPFDLIPEKFKSDSGSYTSGTQNLDKLHTLIDVIYSPLNIDKDDRRVEDAFQTYASATTLLNSTEEAGPFHKFLKGASLGMYDINDQVEGIGDLVSIDDCPAQYLPLLANLIGWKLYGRNEESWRNQLRNAPLIYRKKGTKQGLIDALNAVIPQNPINTSAAVTELYESYLPNLIYYCLATGSHLFDFETYTQEKAFSHGADVYSPSDKDYNIRVAVDTILKYLVEELPDNFIIANEPFRVTRLITGKAWFGPVVNIGANSWTTAVYGEQGEILFDPDSAIDIDILQDPNFVFNFRNRDFDLPPWEEEKFYANCVINEKLLSLLKTLLKSFCVDSTLLDSLIEYIETFVIKGSTKTDIYIGNSFVFYTSGQHYPPNQGEVFGQYKDDQYDYLTLWNGKSSTYDFTVSGGEFTDDVFQDASGRHTTNDILQSLNIVDDVSPAKAIPRVRFTKGAAESASGLDYVCPSVRVGFTNYGTSNAEVCGVYDRGRYGGHGSEIYPDFTDNLKKTWTSHKDKMTFKRSQFNYRGGQSLYASSIFATDQVVPVASGVPRYSLRRRNFYNAIDQKEWFNRSGSNMPSFYNALGNVTTSNAIFDFVKLGFIPSSFGFATPNADNLSGVYRLDCSNSLSTIPDVYFGVPSKNTFLCRSNDTLNFSSCDMFVRRDRIPEEVKLFFMLNEEKKRQIARDILSANSNVLDASVGWVDYITSFSNMLPDDAPDKYYSQNLDRRTRNQKGVNYIYNTYNAYLSATDNAAFPENLATNYTKGGANILSHTYGPIFRNAAFNFDGSALEVSSQLINKSVVDPFTINLALSANVIKNPLSLNTVNSETALNFGGVAEYSTKHILSGINFIDTSTNLTPTNEFAVFDLVPQYSGMVGESAYLENNRTVLLRSRSHGLPRLRWGLRGSDEKNVFVPECDYELTLNYLTGRDNSSYVGGGSVGVMIHTKREIDSDGSGVCFIWNKNNEWEQVYVKDLQSETSRQAILNNYVHYFTDERKDEGARIGACGDDESLNGLQAIRKESFSQGSIKFHTKNVKTKRTSKYATNFINSLSSVYNGENVEVHRAVINDNNRTQNYFVNIMAAPTNSNSDRYALIDSFSIVNKTLNESARMPYAATIPDSSKANEVFDTVTVLRPNGLRLEALPSIPSIRSDGVQLQEYTNEVSLAAKSNPFYFNLPPDLALNNQTTALPLLLTLTPNLLINVWDAVGQYYVYPYTGMQNELYTNSLRGFNNSYFKQRLLSAGRSIYEIRDFFRTEYLGGRSSGVGARPFFSLTENSNKEYRTLASVDRWCDLIWDDQTKLRTVDTGILDVEKITDRYGVLQPVKILNSDTVNVGLRNGLTPPDTMKNPLGYTVNDDSLPPVGTDTTINDLLPIGSPTQTIFYSRRYNRDFDASPHQVDQFLNDVIEKPLGKYPKGILLDAYPELFNDLFAVNSVNYNLNLQQNFGVQTSLVRDFNLDKHRPTPGFYQDVPQSELLSEQTYSFSVYLAKPHDITSMFGPSPQGDFSDKATSAMITLSPMDSSSSYVRLNLNLNTDASSIQKGGRGSDLADATAASCEKIQYTVAGQTLTWYKLKVTLTYDATEKSDAYDLDESLWEECVSQETRKRNDGLRCSIFAYNDAYDNALPTYSGAKNIDIASRVMLWGPSLVKGTEAAEWSREIQSVPHPTSVGTEIEAVVYRAVGNVLSGDRARKRKVFQDDDLELSYISEDSKKMEKLTLAVPTPENPISPTTLFSQPKLFDNKTKLYSGEIFYDLTHKLLRGDVYKADGDQINQDKFLVASGGGIGTFITRDIDSTFQIKPRELLHLFRYFNNLGQVDKGVGFLTRVPSDSAPIHDLSGGSRIVYRSHPDNDTIGTSATNFHSFTNINVEG